MTFVPNLIKKEELIRALKAEKEISFGQTEHPVLSQVERALGTLDATHKVRRNPGLPREEH